MQKNGPQIERLLGVNQLEARIKGILLLKTGNEVNDQSGILSIEKHLPGIKIV